VEEVIILKAEYDLRIMKRKGHPLREKVLRGELKLINPFDIPDIDKKLAELDPDNRDFVNELFKKKLYGTENIEQ